jgi:molecular chaperone GrpE (heat shock protein)
MTIDKKKLQKLLWAEAASWSADCTDWKRNTEALQEFLGEKTVEEVALELLAENEALRNALSGVRESVQREYWDEYAGLEGTRAILDTALSKTVQP